MPTSIGLVGGGNVVASYHLPVLSKMPGVDLRWVTDRDIERARSLAKLYGIPAAADTIDSCEDVDMVLVATPVGSRRELLETVCARGWHAFCEKPFAATTADHRWMIETADRHGVRLGVGLVRRFYETTETARRLLENRTLGATQQIIAGEGAWLRRTGRGADWYQGSAQASGGGVLFETGSHLVDQAFAVCGVQGYEIAECHQQLSNGLEFETSVNGSMTIAGGDQVPFAIVVTRLADVYNGILVRCANADLHVPVSPDGQVEIRRDGERIALVGGERRESAEALYAAIGAEWREFIDACASSRAMTDWDTGLLTTAFIEECYAAESQSPGKSSRVSG